MSYGVEILTGVEGVRPARQSRDNNPDDLRASPSVVIPMAESPFTSTQFMYGTEDTHNDTAHRSAHRRSQLATVRHSNQCPFVHTGGHPAV